MPTRSLISRSGLVAGGFALAAAAIAACGGPSVPMRGAVGVPGVARARGDAGAADGAAADDDGPLPAARSLFLAEGEAFGPYVARSGERAVAVFAPFAAPGERKWKALALDARGEPLGEAKIVAPAPASAPSAIVRPLGAGWALAWVERGAAGDTVRFASFGADLAPRVAPITLAQGAGDVIYVDVVPSPRGALAVVGTFAHAGATLRAVAIGDDGRVDASAPALLERALVWQLVPAPNGALLAAVVAESASPRTGAVVAVSVSPDGRPSAKPFVLSASPTARADLDAVRVGERVVLAWTDERALDPEPFTASIGASGDAPGDAKPAGLAGLDAEVVSLVAAPSGARAWLVAASEARFIHGAPAAIVAPVDANGVLGAARGRVALADGASSLLEAAASDEAPALLHRNERGLFVTRLDASLARRDAIELRSPSLGGARGAAASAWGLGCGRGACFALATGALTPVPVLAIEAGGALAAAAGPDLGAARRLATAATVVGATSLAAVAGRDLGGSALVGWVTRHAPGDPAPAPPPRAAGDPPEPGDPKKPRAAFVGLRPVDLVGRPTGPVRWISVRAESEGGIAIAPGDPSAHDACVAWVARDEGDPQVFVTRVDSVGRKLAQKMVTNAKGAARDVAIARSGAGWVVAWVDARGGKAEVFAARLDAKLAKSAPEVRVSKAAAEVANVAIALDGDAVRVFWDEGGATLASRLEGAKLERRSEPAPASRVAESSLASLARRAFAPHAPIADAGGFVVVADAAPGSVAGDGARPSGGDARPRGARVRVLVADDGSPPR